MVGREEEEEGTVGEGEGREEKAEGRGGKGQVTGATVAEGSGGSCEVAAIQNHHRAEIAGGGGGKGGGKEERGD